MRDFHIKYHSISFIVTFKYFVQDTAKKAIHFLDIKTLLELTNLTKREVLLI